MDPWLARCRGARQLGIALPALHEAAECAREARMAKLVTQLEHLAEEVVYLHRQILDLPSERTPAAQEFSRADLSDTGTPF